MAIILVSCTVALVVFTALSFMGQSRQTSSVSTNTISSSINSQTSSASNLYNVTFAQGGEFTGSSHPPNCYWGIPWYVTFDGITKVQPSNTTQPPDNVIRSTFNQNLSRIIFFTNAGTYNYSIRPSGVFTPQNGTLVVSGNVTVRLISTGNPCPS